MTFPNYIEPLYRPPSEASSLILQVTNGCSWNKCTFCEMYTDPQKCFKPKPQADIEKELAALHGSGYRPRRIFLADGDAMVLSYTRLRAILMAIRGVFPDLQRVSAYCLPRNLRNKSIDELAELNALGLSLMYVGCESGDDEVLEKIHKGETFESSREALVKIKQAGMKSSVMILNGMGGVIHSQQHAINSAKLMNLTQPEYLATLVVSMPHGDARIQGGFDGDFQLPNQLQLFAEMRCFLEHLDLQKTIFRSDHASNYLILKGVLNRDKDKLLAQVDQAIHRPDSAFLREEWQRGL